MERWKRSGRFKIIKIVCYTKDNKGAMICSIEEGIIKTVQ